MSQTVSRFFLPIKFSTARQIIKSGSNFMSPEKTEDIKMEYLVETYIDDTNTDATDEWYYINNSYNSSFMDNRNIVFFNRSNSKEYFDMENSVVALNPKDEDAPYKTLKNNNIWSSDFLPEFSEMMRVRLYVPENNMSAWGEKEQYIINLYLNYNGKKIYLSSGLSTSKKLKADDYKKINNKVFTQYYEFTVISPYAVCEDADWDLFRRNILNTETTINSESVSCEIIPYEDIIYDKIEDEIINEYIYINYNFDCSCYTWINGNNPWFLTLSSKIDKYLLTNTVNYPNTYKSLKHYLNNFKYRQLENEMSYVSFDIKLGIYDLEGNIYWGASDEDDMENNKKFIFYSWDEEYDGEPKENIILNIRTLDIPVLKSWDFYRNDMVIRTFMTIHSRVGLKDGKHLDYPDIELLSNKIPLTRDIFKYTVWDEKYNIGEIEKINIEELSMPIYNLNIVNQNKKEEIVLSNPTASQSVRPVFFRAETLPTIKLNKIKENIALNLTDYINRVKYFKISINGNIVKESGRSGSNIIFAIEGNKIWSQLRESGEINTFSEINNVYLLDQDGELITSGKYMFR